MRPDLVIWLEALVFLMVWAGVCLLIDGFGRRGRDLDLADRLARFQPPTVGDEAQGWLKDQ